MSIYVFALLVLAGCGRGEVVVDPGRPGDPAAGTVSEPSTAEEPAPTRAAAKVILADGVVQAAEPVLPLAFEISGKLKTVYVHPGDLVASGDTLAELEEAPPLDSYQAAVLSAELSVLNAQQGVDDLHTNAPLREAEAQQAVAAAQQALDNLAFDFSLRQSEALQAIAQAEKAVTTAEYRLNSLSAPAAEATLTAAQADVTLAVQRLEQAETAYDPYRNKPEGNLNKANFGAAWAAAQQNYEAAVRYLNALTGTPSELIRAQVEADLVVAQAQLAQAQAAYDVLAGGIPPADLALAEAQLNAAQAAYDSLENGIDPDELFRAEAQLANAQIQLSLAKTDLEKAVEAREDIVLAAPWTGIVLSVDVSVGAFIGSGVPVVTLLDTGELEFQTTNLSERDLDQVFPGQTALVTLKSFPNQPIEATVVRIGWQPGTPAGDAATFPVMLVFSDTDLEIRPGMTGRVEIRSDN